MTLSLSQTFIHGQNCTYLNKVAYDLRKHNKGFSRSQKNLDMGAWNYSIRTLGTSLVVQWLSILPSNAGDRGSIPGQGTKIPHAAGQLSRHAN